MPHRGCEIARTLYQLGVDGHDSNSDNNNPQEEQESSITAGRQMKQIRPLQRYIYANLVAYVLFVVARGHWIKKPSTYLEAIISNEFA